MVRPLDESQGSSPLQGHGSWLVCEVAFKPIALYLCLVLYGILCHYGKVSNGTCF